MQRLVHELEVHQIELEMQNEELRQARDEAENALDKYTDLYDFAPVGYLTLDREGLIGSANLFIAGLLGVERRRLPGRRLGLLVAFSARPAFKTFLETVFSGRTKQSCEVALLSYSRRSHFVQIEALVAASGLECRMAIIDITRRRELEEQISAQHRALVAANIELDAFNYTISHDLRAPLTIIHGYAQILRAQCGEQLPELAKGFLEKISAGTIGMNILLKTLLELSRATHVEMERNQVDLSHMAEQIATGLEILRGERRITFQIATRIIVNGDPELLRVVLINLIGNAWKHSARQEEAVIEIGVTGGDENPACFVRDNGPGFEMAHADKLFLPFQRLPGTTVEGCGVGLSTVERIIRRHGGRVWAESEPGKGATFFFTLG
ncbi:sensor histidine kinase [Desulfuromonas sp. DDH964]|uniref:sensor histidine kinase n=1 Tax=Desulfuromonas sp. DDH964 TaxID=1823759 RepID=UPI0018D2A0F0|nr:ATP-binding protein [Desulfuromonas sp. DDH964]